MESAKEGEKSAVTMLKTKETNKEKVVTWAVPLSSESSGSKEFVLITKPRWKKGVAMTDFLLRLGAIGTAIGSAIIMGTNDEQLPFFTQFLQFHAQWNQFPMFQFFVIANGLISGYVILTLPFSYVCIVRPKGPRLLLMTCDIVMMGIITVAASSAAAIVYLGHNGSQDANWMAFCKGFTNFCQASTEAVVASFVVVIFFMFLVSLSALALKMN